MTIIKLLGATTRAPNRHRGAELIGSASPATPPGMRVRTGRFDGLRFSWQVWGLPVSRRGCSAAPCEAPSRSCATSGLPLGDQLRLEAADAIARHRNLIAGRYAHAKQFKRHHR